MTKTDRNISSEYLKSIQPIVLEHFYFEHHQNYSCVECPFEGLEYLLTVR